MASPIGFKTKFQAMLCYSAHFALHVMDSKTCQIPPADELRRMVLRIIHPVVFGFNIGLRGQCVSYLYMHGRLSCISPTAKYLHPYISHTLNPNDSHCSSATTILPEHPSIISIMTSSNSLSLRPHT